MSSARAAGASSRPTATARANSTGGDPDALAEVKHSEPQSAQQHEHETMIKELGALDRALALADRYLRAMEDGRAATIADGYDN